MPGTVTMAEGRRIRDQQKFEDSETTEPEIVNQFLPGDTVAPEKYPAPIL